MSGPTKREEVDQDISMSNAPASGGSETNEVGSAVPVQVDKQSTALWFGDGNIVLSAPSELAANVTINFRVHTGILRRDTQVFADMLAMPTGATTTAAQAIVQCQTLDDEFYNGLPRVRMQDSAEDLEAFLKVLYEPWALSTKKRATTILSRPNGFLKLADKYNMFGMKAFVQHTLEADWPRSLEHWDLMDNRRTKMQAEGISLTSDLLPEPAAAVRLAKQYQIKSVLPAALYHLSRCEREKKAPIAAPPAPGAEAQPPARAAKSKASDAKARWDLVPLDTLAALYKLRDVTEEVGIALYDAFVLRKPMPGATALCSCGGVLILDGAATRLPNLGRELAERRDVLRTLRVLKATIKKEMMTLRCNRLTQPCGYDGAKVVEKLDTMRLEIWAKLEECSS